MEDNLYTQIIERLAKIEVKIDDIKGLQKKVEEHDKTLVSLIEKDNIQQKQIDELRQKEKDNAKWLWGIAASVIGAIILGLLGL